MKIFDHFDFKATYSEITELFCYENREYLVDYDKNKVGNKELWWMGYLAIIEIKALRIKNAGQLKANSKEENYILPDEIDSYLHDLRAFLKKSTAPHQASLQIKIHLLFKLMNLIIFIRNTK